MILLYPSVGSAAPFVYDVNDDQGQKIRIEFIDVSRNLHRCTGDLIAEFRKILRGERRAAVNAEGTGERTG